MLRRTVRSALAVLAGAAMAAMTAATAGGSAPVGSTAGPPYDFTTEIMHSNVLPLVNAAKINRTKHGYLYRAGKQNGHLVVTPVRGGLRFADTGTAQLRKLPRACRRVKVRGGVGAVCRIPRGVTTRRPLLVEVWPRLGHDFTDGSRLPATVALAVLGDEGRDVARLGAGPDFFNGHSQYDRVSGGAGKDWIRAGRDNDVVRGGPGDDWIVAMSGSDAVRGDQGNDRVYGGEGNDRLRGDAGADYVVCEAGRDRATVDRDDPVIRECESVDRG